MAQSKKLSGSQYAKIRLIKARGYSPSYEKRLIRGVKAGKKTTQESRGHRPGEARQRAAFQRERNEGLSNAEDASVRKWYNKHFNTHFREGVPNEEDVVEFARTRGIVEFRQYQRTWNAARKRYLNELKTGSWASLGLGYLEALTELARVRPQGDLEWLYYH